VGRNLFTTMKYLVILLTTLLIGTRPADNKIKKEKREYNLETQKNGTTLKKLVKTTKFSLDGQVVSEIEACKDSICCHYNKPFKLYDVKREFRYKDQRLILRVFWSCDSLPCYKDFHEYKFDNKKRLIEKRELTYNFETKDKKYEKGQWLSAKIGDSTLTEKNIHQYTYTEFDSVKEEKIIVWSKHSDRGENSWTVNYKYDKNKRLVEEIHPGIGPMKLKATWDYDNKGRLIKMNSNLMHGDNEVMEWFYDDRDRVSSVKDGVMTTNYQYDNNDNLIQASTIGNRYKDTVTKYYYNEFKDLIREEVSYANEPPYVKVFEYSYHQE
ncbi:MAG TPA: hypothetical protein PLD17_14060, partial [Flavobacteriales bacterium]|nr:hypothetical protein [Flavobacteriales bacterium]